MPAAMVMSATGLPLIGYLGVGEWFAAVQRRSPLPISAKPSIIIAQVAGSGTDSTGVAGTWGVAATTGSESISPPPPPGGGMSLRTGGPPGPPGLPGVTPIGTTATGGAPASAVKSGVVTGGAIGGI